LDPSEQQCLAEAVRFALAAHAGQVRKGSGAPYACHLLQVAGLVLEHGGNVEQTAAGVLHDVMEDCGVPAEEIEKRFGAEVARIVSACSDLLPGDTPERKSPWMERKLAFLESLGRADPAVRLVAGCDKLDNLRSLVADLEAEGIAIFELFNATAPQTLWYYREVAAVLEPGVSERLVAELAGLVDQLGGWVPLDVA
jgi:(p)ppGpp synthase/HD superfamily hydrolase